MLHSLRICSIVCTRLPQGHLLVFASPQRCRFFCVLPTLDLALLRVTQSFLGRFVPLGRSSLGSVFSGGCVPFLPSIDSVAGSFIRVKALICHETAARSKSASWLDMAIECVSWVGFLFEFLCLCLDCSSDVRGGQFQQACTL